MIGLYRSVVVLVIFFNVSHCSNQLQTLHQRDINETLPSPHMIILGQTGAGKSSLANVLIGHPADCENCTFEVCQGGLGSCTKETKYGIGNYAGSGALVTIVDTPGFGDTDGETNELIDEMIVVLKEVIKTGDVLILAFDGTDSRWDAVWEQMLREMEALFGEDNFWEHAILEATKWAYTEDAINARNRTGTNETVWAENMNGMLREKLGVKFDLPAVFIDSWATFSLDDPLQQEAYQRETAKLWEFAQSVEPFEFKTVQDILNELTECKTTMEENITEIWRAMTEAEEAITKNAVDIVGLDMDLGNLADEVSSGSLRQQEVNSHIAADIAGHQEMLDEHEADLTRHQDMLLDHENSTEYILGYIEASSPPLGTILPWTNRPSKDTSNFIAMIPDGWQACDGGPIERGIWAGQLTPNLNGNELFLRGSSDGSKLLDVEEDSFQDHQHVDSGHSHTDGGHHHDVSPHSHDISTNFHNNQFWGKGGSSYETKLLTGITGWEVKQSSINNTEEAGGGNTKVGWASIQSSSSGVEGVKDDYRKGDETRPKNMRVFYIMRTN